MYSSDKLKTICNCFISNEISIYEFQQRLMTILFDGEFGESDKKLCQIINNAYEELESIIFLEADNEAFKHGCDVANYILQELSKVENNMKK